MPTGFCLLPKHADELRAKIASGALDVSALVKMSSEERRAALAQIVGELSAPHLNAAFESKLLLKNQQQGLETWVKQQTGLKPDVQRDLLARVQRLDRVLEPKDLHAFLSDLAAQKLGFGVTMDEAGTIAKLSKAAADARAAQDWSAFGEKQVAFENYVADLKNGVKKPLTIGRAVTEVGGLTKSVKAAWDDSAPFRQGWKTIFSHSVVWQANTRKTFADMWNTLGGKAVMDQLKADAYSRENSRNGYYKKAKLALWNQEEQFPSSLPEKIPGVGRLYKASENAFQGFQYRMRLDLFDKYIGIAQKVGVELNDPAQLESIGKLVNSLTSRGHLGKAEGAADVVNVVAFSARKFKSDLDFLTAHQGQQGVTPFVRKQAALNLVKTVAGTAAILALADAVAPGSVEWDPRSADFGQIKIGSTRFDMTGGMRQLPILAARLIASSTKSSTSDKITKLNTGKFGAPTSAGVVGRFARNKLSPIAGVGLNHLMGQDFKGDSPTALGDLSDLFEPFPTSTAREVATTPHAVPVAAGVFADMLGVSVNSYDEKKHTKLRRPYFSLPQK